MGQAERRGSRPGQAERRGSRPGQAERRGSRSRQAERWKTPGRIGIGMAAAAMLLAGCAVNDSTLPPTGANKFSGPPAVPRSLEQIATEQATAMMHRFYSQYSKVLTDPATPENTLDPLVLPSFYRDAKLLPDIHASRAPGVKVTGAVRASIVRADNFGMEIPRDHTGAAKPGEAKLRLKVCEDRSALQVIKDGVEVKDPKILTAQLRAFDASNPGWPGAGGWVITGAFYTDNEPCDMD